MKIILGIGNPGRQYARTRHNVGFRVVDELARMAEITVGKARFVAMTGQGHLEGQKVLLVKPQTFVNQVGRSAQAACAYYRVDPTALLVVVDDFNLPAGKLRFRARGSAGGHNGLKSLIEHLGTDDFHRLRLGIGDAQESDSPAPRSGDPDAEAPDPGPRTHGAPDRDQVDYVLSRFKPEEKATMDAAIETAVRACRSWVRQGIEACMNRYN